MKFSESILPRPIELLLKALNFIAHGFLGLICTSIIFISTGYIVAQSYYLLRNENAGKETTKEFIELIIIYLSMFVLITKMSEFFER